MDTFGDRLKSEREDRGWTNQAVAEVLHVDIDLLQALERNDFDALPDETVMMDCLHAYAECLQVDADAMIKDYVRERAKHLRRLEAELAEQAVETPRRLRFSPWLIALVVVAIAMLAAWWAVSRDGTAPPPEAPVAVAPVEPEPLPSKTPDQVAPTPTETPDDPASTPVDQPADAVPPPVEPPAEAAPDPLEPPADVASTAVEQPTARSAPTDPAPSALRITEFGVGTGVEDRNLVGQSDRFAEGTRVWFWTRVEGGASGHKIDHVWLRQGVEGTHLSLEIGGPSWRTYSIQTLFTGAAGDWAVEARDDQGRVLARSEFVCVP